jgi:hypothetical protein
VTALCGTLTVGTLVLSLFLRTVPAATPPAPATETLGILGAAP